jgi:dTDP-4-dehydrorhamnose reductase
MKPVVAVTGGKGLVGSRFVSDFADKYDFLHLDISDPVTPVDITKFDQVMNALANTGVTGIVHFAAYTDVTGSWKQTGDKSGIAYQVNVVGTETMVQAANELDAQLIHISTSYVFDGEKDELYLEDDQTNPIEWYGHTKAWAEEAVEKSAKNWTILRIDQPFRPDVFPKADIVQRLLAGLREGTLYPQFTDHYFGPTFIPDFAKILDWSLRTKATGLFHASSGEKWSDYEFACAVAKAHDFDPAIIKEGSLAEYLKTSERPYQKNTAMNNQKLRGALDFEVKKIDTALSLLK